MAQTGNAFEKTRITGTGTTLIARGPGVLHSIVINGPAATGTIELDDALTQTNPFALITTSATPVPVSLIYDAIFQTGLSVTTATAGQDITVNWLNL